MNNYIHKDTDCKKPWSRSAFTKQYHGNVTTVLEYANRTCFHKEGQTTKTCVNSNFTRKQTEMYETTLPKTNIAIENPPFWWYLQGNKGVFMGYVSFREGIRTNKQLQHAFERKTSYRRISPSWSCFEAAPTITATFAMDGDKPPKTNVSSGALMRKYSEHGEITRPTLSKTNIVPENRPSQKETSVPTIHFQGIC